MEPAIKRNNKLISEIITKAKYDNNSIKSAKIVFSENVDKGIIYDCSFDDNIWYTTNERDNIGVRFNFSEISYKKYYEKIFGIPFNTFVDYSKTYFMFHINELVLGSLRDTINDINKMIAFEPQKIEEISNSFSSPFRLIDFLSSIQIETKVSFDFDVFFSHIETNIDSDSKGKQRELPTYSTMFLFDGIINDFWETEKNTELKLFFAPLYINWEVTKIIPTRPIEIIMTPRDCLTKINKQNKKNDYYLTLRKDNLKGRGKSVANKISEDFKLFKTYINDKTGITIENYIEDTKDFAPTDIETLFIADPHYYHWGQKKHSDSRYFTYINMSTLLRCFYDEIIVGRYGLRIVPRGISDVMKNGDIERIYLGDTRHYAMINAIMEGCTPVTAMLLAGQDSIETASHYYSNIEKYVKCETYRAKTRILGGKIEYNINIKPIIPAQKEYTTLGDGSRCYSEKYRNHDFNDCLLAVGPSGEVGYCPECEFHRKNSQTLYVDDAAKYKKNITDACSFLKDSVDLYRKGQGDKEGVMRAIQKLQDESLSYKKYLEEKQKNIEG